MFVKSAAAKEALCNFFLLSLHQIINNNFNIRSLKCSLTTVKTNKNRLKFSKCFTMYNYGATVFCKFYDIEFGLCEQYLDELLNLTSFKISRYMFYKFNFF